MKAPAKRTPKPAKKAGATGKKRAGFTSEEKAAMKDRVREMQAEAQGSGKDGKNEEAVVLEKIASLPESDREMAQRIHALVKATAPTLNPKTWYGMPAYAKNGAVVCFFQDAHKFKTRYATLGFSDKAKLDEGSMWPVSFALKALTPAEEARIRALVKRAIS